MPKKKISENVSEQLESIAQEALQQLNPEEVEEKPKRKRRTKAEMAAAREEEERKSAEVAVLKCVGSSHITAKIVEWDKDKDDDTVLPMLVEIPDSILVDDYDIETVSDYISDASSYCHKGFELIWPEHHEDQDQFCQWEIEKAHLEGKSEPDFDFRLFYQKGDKVYLVRNYDTLKTKEIIYMTLRTIYARMMIGVVEKQYCQCVGFSDRDYVFYNKSDALDYFNSIQAKTVDEYNEETGKKKRKRKKAVDEDITDSESYDDESEDEDNE